MLVEQVVEVQQEEVCPASDNGAGRCCEGVREVIARDEGTRMLQWDHAGSPASSAFCCILPFSPSV